ncbi:hypothetical protein [Adhaeretor mobilis]|uniref:Uncharacterized protein n=1 Tax=Adhaeretor mobilis TaxID=1930276 RepID=A0A517MQY2_9BACT|nr:hypothetical protein [Adhaeretor mobilis]QDS97271.1 hypothetical protein HG15A2_05320 [Adhaeretor mobilis]
MADLVVLPVPEGEKPDSPDFDSLIDLVTSTVEHDSWMENGVGGMNEIRPFPTNFSLVVSASGRVHDELRGLLQTLRDVMYKLPEKYLASFREAVARKRSSPTIITWNPIVGPKEHQRIENHFRSAVRELTNSYGEPNAITKAGEADFPKWATAQQIAVWNRSGGKLYFALQDARPTGEALIAGWWEDSFGRMKPVEFSTEQVGFRTGNTEKAEQE